MSDIFGESHQQQQPNQLSLTHSDTNGSETDNFFGEPEFFSTFFQNQRTKKKATGFFFFEISNRTGGGRIKSGSTCFNVINDTSSN